MERKSTEYIEGLSRAARICQEMTEHFEAQYDTDKNIRHAYRADGARLSKIMIEQLAKELGDE
jgi:hypothetical protein